MKYIYGTNVTEDEKNVISDDQIFISERLPSELMESFVDNLIDMYEKGMKAKLPFFLSAIKSISGLLAVLCGVGLIPGYGDVTMAQAYKNAPYLFYAPVLFFIIWLSIFLMERRLHNKFMNSEEKMQSDRHLNSYIANSREILKVPEEAKVIDVLVFQYKHKNGNIKFTTDGLAKCRNIEAYVFVEDGNLYIVDFEEKRKIPLESIIEIKKIKKSLNIPNWNKEVPFHKGEYKQYKMTRNNMGLIFFKPYYAVCIQQDGELYEMLVPPYELDTISKLIGIHI